MGNVMSLTYKMDVITALSSSQRKYWECSLMCLTQTWLHKDIPDDVSSNGFQTVRADRDCTGGVKRKGGGLAIPSYNRWYNPGQITVKECICSWDI